MAGHSKFANIRHRKAAQDAKRGKLFTKLISEITVAARMGGDDIASNPRLRDAVEKALKANMTRDTVDRAVKRGAGGAEGKMLEEIIYEGYGPGGVAVMVRCLTDNRNRTVADVRHAFTKSGGNLAVSGSVAYLFNPCGVIRFASDVDQEALFEAALEAGASDVELDEEAFQVITALQDFFAIKEALEKQGFANVDSECTQVATTTVAVDQSDAEKLLRLVDLLEDLDDVQQVYSNADIPDEFLASE